MNHQRQKVARFLLIMSVYLYMVIHFTQLSADCFV